MMLRNQWYVAAWSHDLDKTPLARTVLGQPIVLFRDGEGKPVALRDRCPHRAVPLSLGRVVDGRLECGYHGLRFDGGGRCVKVPGQEILPPRSDVESYPVVERWRWIWVWLGDTALARPEDIPAFPWLTEPGWAVTPGVFEVGAGYELVVENLNNHAHVSFVHRKTIGTDDFVNVKTKVRRVGNQVHAERWLLDCPPPALFAKAGGFEGKVDRWANGVFTAPSHIVLDIGCAPVGSGAPEGNRSKGIEIRSLHTITPVNESRCLYHWAYVRNFKIDDPHVSEVLHNGATATFLEDVEFLEAQQANMERMPGEDFIDINSDAAPLMALRILRELSQASAKAAE